MLPPGHTSEGPEAFGVLICEPIRYDRGMGKIGGLVALGLVALTGCSAPAASGPTPTGAAVTAQQTTAATVTARPVAPASDNKYSEADYLAGVRKQTVGLDAVSDADLIAAGKEACAKFIAGTPRNKIIVVTGGSSAQAAANNNAIRAWAGGAYCSKAWGFRG